MRRLCAQSTLHARNGAARNALGARGRAGHDAKTFGSRPDKNADTQANGRASFRNVKGVDGSDPLPHSHARTSEYRDESSRSGIQPQAHDEDHGNRTLDRSDENLAATRLFLLRLLA